MQEKKERKCRRSISEWLPSLMHLQFLVAVGVVVARKIRKSDATLAPSSFILTLFLFLLYVHCFILRSYFPKQCFLLQVTPKICSSPILLLPFLPYFLDFIHLANFTNRSNERQLIIKFIGIRCKTRCQDAFGSEYL